MVCEKCGSFINDGDMFCGECGNKVEVIFKSPSGMTCKNCGSIIAAGDMFCGECGTPVTAAEAPSFDPIYSVAERTAPAVDIRYCDNCGTKLAAGEKECPVCSARREAEYIRPVTEVSTGPIKVTMRESSVISEDDETMGSIYFRRPSDI